MNKKVKTLMLIGVILSGVSFLITVICTLLQDAILGAQNVELANKNVVPSSLSTSFLVLLMRGIFLMVVHSDERETNKSAGIGMIVVSCIYSIIMPYAKMISNMLLARQGVEMLAATGVLDATIGNVTMPFSVVSSALIMVALGRYTLDE